MVVTTSERVVLTSPGAVAERGWIVLNAWSTPQAKSACFLKASLDAVGEVMQVERYWSSGSMMRWLGEIN